MEWTSRDRVIASINHRMPDRVPIDITIELEPYLALKKHLKMKIEEQLKPDNMMEVIPDPQLLTRLGADLISLKLGKSKKKQPPNDDGSVSDDWGVRWRKVQVQSGGCYNETVGNPLANASLADLSRYHWPNPREMVDADGLKDQALRLFDGTTLAIVGRFGGPILEAASNLLGWQQFLEKMIEDPVFISELLDRVCDIQMQFDEIGLNTAGRYLQIFKASGEDLGMQQGPLVSRSVFENLLKPRLCRRWQAARRLLDSLNPECKIMLHSCGAVRCFIPDFIECGIDILDPLQPNAVGMNSKELKKEFGAHLAFHGGIDIQRVLPFGSHSEIAVEVERRIQDYAPDGGYILAAAHNIQADVHPSNVVAMCDAALSYGRYPLQNS